MRQQLEITTWMRMIRLVQRVQQQESALLAQHHLTLAQFDVLARLLRHDNIRQQELADDLLVTKGNICGLLDRLAARGLVERCADPDDGRSHRIFLTDAGRSVIASIIPIHDALLHEIMGSLPDNTLSDLSKAVRQLEHHVRR